MVSGCATACPSFDPCIDDGIVVFEHAVANWRARQNFPPGSARWQQDDGEVLGTLSLPVVCHPARSINRMGLSGDVAAAEMAWLARPPKAHIREPRLFGLRAAGQVFWIWQRDGPGAGRSFFRMIRLSCRDAAGGRRYGQTVIKRHPLGSL